MRVESNWAIMVKPPFGNTTKEIQRRIDECGNISISLNAETMETLQRIFETLECPFILELESRGRRTFNHTPSSPWTSVWRKRGNNDTNTLIEHIDVPQEDCPSTDSLADNIHAALQAAIMHFDRNRRENADASPLKRRKIIHQEFEAAVPDLPSASQSPPQTLEASLS